FKSVFFKYFSLIGAVVAGGFLAMTCLQILFSARALNVEKRELLQVNAERIATHTVMAATQTHISHDGHVVYQLDQTSLSPLLNLLSDAIDADVLITDSRGRVLLCSEKSMNSLIGNTAPSQLLPRIEDSYYEIGQLAGLYKERQHTVAVPVTVDDQALAYVFVCSPAEGMLQILTDNLRIYALSVAGALLLCVAVLWLLTYRFVRPLRQMAAATRRYARGDFSARTQVKGKDEVAELAVALNQMAVSLSSLETMRRSFIANVSHELKTPMTTIAGFIDGILDGTVPADKQAHYLRIVSDEVKRLSRLVRSMQDLSRIDAGELKLNSVRLDLTEVVGRTLVSFEKRIEEKRLRITGLEEYTKLEIAGDYDLMNQVVYNLLDNAIKFTNEGGDIDIRLARENGWITAAIRNSGEGIPACEMPQIFERFYKSDRSRSLDKNGMGLGLYIVQTVIRLHGGEITVRSLEGEFTEFSFWLPAVSEGVPMPVQ
ncbi:MAG: HAMP domain-containing histidine kinase, partial [Clostridia bacterium]|nr:HAMP domain-containing histidine kinase [Clostridia bacterium]